MSAAAIYRAVIDEVIKNVREEFIREGIDDSVLLLLQQNWELKLAQENTVPAFTSATLDPSLIMPLPPLPSPTPFHNPPVPRPAGMGVATPAPAIPHATSAQPYNPSSVHAQRPAMPSHIHHLPPITNQPLAQHVTHNFLAGTGDDDRSPLPSFSPAQFNPPATWTPQAQQAAAAANRKHPTADSNSSAPPQKRQQLARPPGAAPAVGRQADGAGDEDTTKQQRALADRQLQQLIAGVPLERVLGQMDGIEDDDDEDPLGASGPKLGSQDSGLEKLGEEDLGPDLDDPEEKEPETQHLVVCQFEKVTRVKNKRKCNLKDGIMLLNGKEHLFHKATGEFDW